MCCVLVSSPRSLGVPPIHLFLSFHHPSRSNAPLRFVVVDGTLRELERVLAEYDKDEALLAAERARAAEAEAAAAAREEAARVVAAAEKQRRAALLEAPRQRLAEAKEEHEKVAAATPQAVAAFDAADAELTNWHKHYYFDPNGCNGRYNHAVADCENKKSVARGAMELQQFAEQAALAAMQQAQVTLDEMAEAAE